MNSERMKEIEDLYHRASALSPDRREEFLAQACAGDDALREEVESLLSCEQAAEPFMEIPAFRDLTAASGGGVQASTDLTGRTIGRYRIREKAGSGGMGVVYRALDTRLGRTVALKVLPPDVTADPERRSRFVREAKAASALNHRNIITIFDIDRADGIDFIAMEYVAGRTLQDIIAGKSLTVSDTMDIAVQIADALVAAHSAGIIHRDVKPANIMISGYPAGPCQVKVLDFGLAKLVEAAPPDDTLSTDVTKSSIVGTAAYMSPEQAEGKQVDARTDLFSFGSVFYEMLSGRRAFQGDSSLAVLSAVLKEDPEPLPGVQAKLQNIVARCLQKNPESRIQSAVELKTALEACLLPFPAASSQVKTIAVLPFANLSCDKENEYFSDGLTEEMIGALARLPGLRVTARTSAFALRGRNMDAREIGARLNVEHLLEGSVRSSGNRVRVAAQLINAADGYQLWAERYDREMRDVLDIQEEIAHAIVETLRVHLTRDTSIVRRGTDSPEAYSLYLRGRYYQEKKTPEAYSRAKQCFEDALAADPAFAPALLGLAEFHWQNAFYGFRHPKEAMAEAKKAAAKALAIDDALAEGHAQMGTLLGVADRDWKAAGEAFRRALELDANSPYVLFRYANFYLWPRGQAEEAASLMERVLSVDPLWVLANWVLAYYIYARRRYEAAVRHLLGVIEMEPSFYLAHLVLGLAYAQQKMPEESVRAFEKACELSPKNPFTLGTLAYGLGMAGRGREAEDIIGRLKADSLNSYVPAKSLMFAYAGIHDAQSVLEWTEKSLEECDPMTIMNLAHEPVLDFVRPNVHYRDIFFVTNSTNFPN